MIQGSFPLRIQPRTVRHSGGCNLRSVTFRVYSFTENLVAQCGCNATFSVPVTWFMPRTVLKVTS